MEPTANGIGGDLFAIVWDPRDGKLHGLNASGRSPLALTADMVPPEPDGTIPLFSPYSWSVPGTRRRLVRAAREVRQAAAGAGARAGDPLRRGGLPAVAGHRRATGSAARRASRTSPASPRCSCPAAARRAKARSSATRRWRSTLRLVARRRRATPTTAARSPTRSCATRSAQRRLLLAGGLRAAPLRLGRARLDQLPRLRRVGAAAERAGHRRAADAEHPRELRPRGDGPRLGRLLARDDRGQEARVRRPRALLRRSRSSPRCRSSSCCRRTYAKRARRADRHAARGADATCPATPPRSAAARRPTCAPPTTNGMMVSLIQSNYTGFGSGYVVPGAGLRPPEPRRPVQPRRRAARTRSSRASGRSTPSSRRS